MVDEAWRATHPWADLLRKFSHKLRNEGRDINEGYVALLVHAADELDARQSKLGELSKAYDAEVSLRKDVQNHRDHCAEVILRRDEKIKEQGCRLDSIFELADGVGRSTINWQETDELVSKIKNIARVVERQAPNEHEP